MFLILILFAAILFATIIHYKHDGPSCQCKKCSEYREANPHRFNVHH